jgi:hypothetical protein
VRSIPDDDPVSHSQPAAVACVYLSVQSLILLLLLYRPGNLEQSTRLNDMDGNSISLLTCSADIIPDDSEPLNGLEDELRRLSDK